MFLKSVVLLLLILASLLGAVCTKKPAEQQVSQNQINELRNLGKHDEADALASKLGVKEEKRLRLPESYEETMDAGDDPLTPGCVCCYGDPRCTTIIGRSVDECFPGGDGGDDLSENIAGTDCVQGVACAQRKMYKCSEIIKGSVCRLRKVTCCGVETTSGFCVLEL